MILIDMNLPKAPDEMVEIAIFGDGKVLQTGESWRSPENGKCYYTTTTPEKHFQAVELPLHGRLIDADALIDDLKRQCKEVFRIDAVSPEDYWINRNEAYRQRLYESWCEGFYEYVGSRTTIIPAEGEETCTKS